MKGLIILVVLLVACGLTAAHADNYTYQLTGDWLGRYYAQEYFDGTLDFGVQFSSIESVSISWQGTQSPGFDDDSLPVQGYFEASLWNEELVMATLQGPLSPFSYSTSAFNTQQTFNLTDMDFLLSGQPFLDICYWPDTWSYYEEDAPYGDITSASLIISGTPIVPEPSSILPMALGLSGLATTWYRRRSSR